MKKRCAFEHPAGLRALPDILLSKEEVDYDENTESTPAKRYPCRLHEPCRTGLQQAAASSYSFCLLFVLTALLGALFTEMGVHLENPATHHIVTAQNFFSKAGIQWLLTNMVKNFTGFAPLGLVITMTMAIGFCEESGLLVSLLNRSMRRVPPALVPYLIAFVGTLGNIASDTAAVVIPPLGALVYLGVKKHPVAGMIVGYAGANAGFTANLMVAGTDSLLQGLTNEAIKGFLGNQDFAVDVTCNWYFMVASTFLVALVIGWLSQKL